MLHTKKMNQESKPMAGHQRVQYALLALLES